MNSKNVQRGALASVTLAALIFVVNALFSIGLYEQQVIVKGPFQVEADFEGSRAFTLDLRQYYPLRKGFSSGGDTLHYPVRSTLEASVGGIQLAPPHTLHDTIRTAGGGAYSHWGDSLFFSLPTGIENTKDSTLVLTLPLRFSSKVINTGYFLGGIGSLILLWGLRVRDPSKYVEIVSRALGFLGASIYYLLAGSLLLSALYLGTVVWGGWSGFALPNTAFFFWMPGLNGIALQEPFFGHALLIVALIGFIGSWGASTLSGQKATAYKDTELRLERDFGRYGLVFVVGLFLYSVGATWAGIPRAQDLSGNAIAGLLPFNDANGHFQHIYFQALQGNWDPFVSRRPLAAALKTVAVVGVDFNNYYYLLLQTVLLAAASFFAVRAIVAWRGIWAGLTYLALLHILVRHYLPTNLTEPMGLFWAIASVPFLVRAIRFNRRGESLAGFHLTLWALMTRMGAMFTVPAMGLWIVVSNWGGRLKVILTTTAVALTALATVILIAGISSLYGSNAGTTGANFSHTICGLTHGTNWTGCADIYAEELKSVKNELELSEVYYAKAKENFIKNPGVFFGRLLEGESYFINGVWHRILSGYTGVIPDGFPKTLWWLAALFGGGWVLMKWREENEFTFWLLFLLGLLASAPFVIFDDGWRVLSSSFPIMALLVALGFTSPLHSNSCAQRNATSYTPIHKWRYLGMVVVAGLCVVVPGAAYKFDLLGKQSLPKVDLADDEDIYLGTRRMSGFLVIPDEDPLPINVPAIHQSSFVKIIRNSGIEQYEPLVTPAPRFKPPFAIASAIAVNRKNHGLLVMPPEVFSSLDDTPWVMRTEKGQYWLKVVEAKRLYN